MGVDVAHFRKTCDPETPVRGDIQALKRPVIGFFGLIADWVDLKLIRFLADSRPDWSFALIGKIATSVRDLERVSNVEKLAG